jgi:spore germination protein KC
LEGIKVNKSRLVFRTLLILLLIFTPGCWDQTEVEDLAVIRAIGVDYLPGRRSPYLVTLAVKRPAGLSGEDGGSGEPTELYTGVGASINLAIQQASFSLAKAVFLSHTDVIIVGEELAKHGLNHHLLDFIVRNPQTRLNMFLLITKGMAHDVLSVPERLEDSNSDEILSLIKVAAETSESNPQEIFKFLFQMTTPGQDPHAAVINVGPRVADVIPELDSGEEESPDGGGEGGGGGGGGNGGGESSGGGEKEEDKILSLDGTAVFDGDKLAGILNHIESRGVLWLRGDVTRGVMTVNDPLQPEHTVNLFIARTQTKVTPVVSNGRFFFRVEIESEGDILSQTSDADLATPEAIEKLNSAKAGAIKEEIEKGLSKIQELQTDIVGFGTLLNRRHHKLFKNMADRWPEEFSKLNVEIHVTANVRRTGQHSNPTRINR